MDRFEELNKKIINTQAVALRLEKQNIQLMNKLLVFEKRLEAIETETALKEG